MRILPSIVLVCALLMNANVAIAQTPSAPPAARENLNFVQEAITFITEIWHLANAIQRCEQNGVCNDLRDCNATMLLRLDKLERLIDDKEIPEAARNEALTNFRTLRRLYDEMISEQLRTALLKHGA